MLSEELRQRMRAAIQAERGEAIGQDQKLGTGPERRATAPGTADSGATSSAANGVNRAAKPDHAIESGRATRSVKSRRTTRSVRSDRAAAPVKLVKSEPAAGPEPVAKPQPAARSKPAHSAPANHKSAAVLRTAPSERPEESVQNKPVRRHFMARLVASALVVLAAASLGLAVSRYVTSWRTENRVSSAQQPRVPEADKQAATWIAQQVSRGTVVSCDETMCAALKAVGFPSANLRVLGSSTPGLLDSAVVVATPTVNGFFGSNLSSSWAPLVLATIGSGDAEVTIRVVVADAAAYQADQAARKELGAYLVKVPGVTVSSTAETQLITGQVDSRVLMAIVALASDSDIPIDIVQFGNIGPGVSPDVPLRFAYLAENGQPAHMTNSAYVRSMRAYLGKVTAAARPASIEPAVFDGQPVLRIEFLAPEPLGLLGPSKSR
jgi:hypothetical protein